MGKIHKLCLVRFPWLSRISGAKNDVIEVASNYGHEKHPTDLATLLLWNFSSFGPDRGGGVMRFYWQFERIQHPDFIHKLYLMFHWLNICKTDRRRHKGWLIACIYWHHHQKRAYWSVWGERACSLHRLSPTCARAWLRVINLIFIVTELRKANKTFFKVTSFVFLLKGGKNPVFAWHKDEQITEFLMFDNLFVLNSIGNNSVFQKCWQLPWFQSDCLHFIYVWFQFAHYWWM